MFGRTTYSWNAVCKNIRQNLCRLHRYRELTQNSDDVIALLGIWILGSNNHTDAIILNADTKIRLNSDYLSRIYSHLPNFERFL